MTAPSTVLPQTIACPRSKALHAYWAMRRGSRRMPQRADIDPIDLSRLLASVFLVDVERGAGIRFRIRLAGTHIETAFEQPLAGAYLDELALGQETTNVLLRYYQVVEERRAVLSRHDFVLNESFRRFSYERLLLPLGLQSDFRVDMMLGSVCFDAPLATCLSLGSRHIL